MMGLMRHRVRHKTYLSFDPADLDEARAFADFFDHSRDVLRLPTSSISSDTQIHGPDAADHMLRRLRELYLQDTVITMVLIGACTWARRSVDWEIKASLQQQGVDEPNGLLGIVLPSAGSAPSLPLRLQTNLGSGYARLYPYTPRLGQLATYMRDAFQLRASSANLIDNYQPLQQHDKPCG